MPQRGFRSNFPAKLYLVSAKKAGSKISHYNFGSYPLDTVVRAKARKNRRLRHSAFGIFRERFTDLDGLRAYRITGAKKWVVLARKHWIRHENYLASP